MRISQSAGSERTAIARHMETAPTRYVASLDFSYFQQGSGAGVVIFGGRFIRQSAYLSLASHKAATSLLKRRRHLGSALRLAFYGVHLREHRVVLQEFLSAIKITAVEKACAVISPTAYRITEVLKDYKIDLLLVDQPDRREEAYLQEIREKIGVKIVLGKNYFVSLSDIVAYYAALLSHLKAKPEDKKAEEKRVDYENILKRLLGEKLCVI
ncbi:hypothetical protein CGL51_12750 [Pyrobaculum aerophilum]|uniref:Uncharacterized protein n=3 Tax=Pyrobaculum aerophilum TaxID=13773 RepID=Q8ZZ03_PYRAE|nr:hypothetical protein [Pyrobaculum aerophilum]AAL62838.1 hypothetical protein PAE0514 [Pyrobaculum aerophilum str. IM2]RFA93505.1 hypothetical protein CGL51_12750 [Pyrobaculum aerophilum]RFA97230.1 hypothetical protein CGL52_09680 [Pyrobaculum aerophilum]HII46265.1 hypothetical protein [Pyrobaculum aerophilum]